MRGRLLLLMFLVLGASRATAQTGLLDQPQTFPWSVGLAPVTQEEAGGLSPGFFRIKSSLLWFNTYRQYGFNEKMSQRVDEEGLLTTLSAAWSPAPGWELRGQAQGWSLGGGSMDAMLSGFHGVLFLPNQGRDLVSDGENRDYLKGWFDESGGAGMTQVSVGTRAFSGSWSWNAWVKPPVPAPVDWGWTDRWSLGAGGGWGDRWSWTDSGLVLGAGVSAGLLWTEAETGFPGESGGVTYQAALYATLESPWLPRALVQGSWTRVPREGEGYLSQGAGLLSSGFQIPLGSGWTLELALTEEFFTWATMEVGFQAGVAWNPEKSVL